MELFTLADPKSTYPASPVSSRGNHADGSCPHSPLALLPPDQPGGSHMGLSGGWSAPLLRKQQTLLSDSSLLACWPHLA